MIWFESSYELDNDDERKVSQINVERFKKISLLRRYMVGVESLLNDIIYAVKNLNRYDVNKNKLRDALRSLLYVEQFTGVVEGTVSERIIDAALPTRVTTLVNYFHGGDQNDNY